MPLLTNGFTGKMNLDTQAYRIPTGDWVDAINITRDSPADGSDVVVANVVGNSQIIYPLPAGTNKCIGKYEDKLRNRVYIFIWNSNDFDSILYYDRVSNQIYNLIQNIVDTYGDILNFNPSKRINHVDIIYRDNEGDLLYWTDGYNSPRKINVTTTLQRSLFPLVESYIEVAKAPPLTNPLAVYGTDNERNANALRRSLFMFTHRWRYDDFEKSTFSTYSKVALPIGYYGSDNDIDNTKNNFITVTVQTGPGNVTDIEVAMRQSNGSLWGDFLQIAVLNKEQLGIADNTTYDFLFYNDALYPPIPQAEQIQLFDWVPQTADGQVLGNGNIPVYGAITEGYNSFPVSELEVTITATNVTNVPPDTDPPSMTYVQVGDLFTFTVSGTVPDGTQYTVAAYVGFPLFTIQLAQYTALPGDTTTDVATGLYNYVAFNYPSYAGGTLANTWGAILPSGSSILHIDILTDPPAIGEISTEKTWLYDCNYLYGIVYVDKQNRDMPGVTTNLNPNDSDSDFIVTTPSFSLSGTDVQTPVVTATINHTPPEGAVAFYWVRRRLSYGDFIFYETCDFQEEDGFYYFCLANIEKYKEDNSQFIYSTAPITSESRIKIIAGITHPDFNGDIYSEDYQILGTVVRTLTGGSSPDNDQTFIKVKIPDSAPSPVYTANMLVMVYTPMRNPTEVEDSVYWEWGESYGIYEYNGVRYHRGSTQDQNPSQAAIYTWTEGDVYFHTRSMYNQILASIDPTTDVDTLPIMDANFSDFFPSAVNDNGRGQAIESNAVQAFNPTLVRFGGAYQSGTTVNQTNRFYFSNFDEYDRSNGAIRKMYIEGRRLFIFQEFDIGVVPVLTQIVRDTAGNPLEANSDALLNKITYPYLGKYGIGDVPESFAYGKGAKYGIDNNKGVAWRLSQDGLTPLSVVYECNNFFVTQTAAYSDSYNVGTVAGGTPTIYGVFNEYTNRVIWAFSEIDRTYDVASLQYTIEVFFVFQRIVTFLTTASNGLTITMHLSSTFGSDDTITYVTEGETTPEELKEIFLTRINALSGFSALSWSSTAIRIGDGDVGAYEVSVSISVSAPPDFYQAPKTIVYNESRRQSEKGFETFIQAYPEMMGCLNNLLLMFKEGNLWVHENAPYCNFFGEQFGASIYPIFNSQQADKKTFISTTQYGSKAWPCTEIVTQMNSYGNTAQLSHLVAANFARLENDYNASFMRDENSQGGWVNGWSLKGNWVKIKCELEEAPDFEFLNGVVVKYIDSPLNNR